MRILGKIRALAVVRKKTLESISEQHDRACRHNSVYLPRCETETIALTQGD
jgi:hypothetical protein